MRAPDALSARPPPPSPNKFPGDGVTDLGANAGRHSSPSAEILSQNGLSQNGYGSLSLSLFLSLSLVVFFSGISVFASLFSSIRNLDIFDLGLGSTSAPEGLGSRGLGVGLRLSDIRPTVWGTRVGGVRSAGYRQVLCLLYENGFASCRSAFGLRFSTKSCCLALNPKAYQA